MTAPEGDAMPPQRVPAAGEVWAYRARGQDPLVQVAVVRLGVRKPQRVLVRFVDDEFEGRQDWVPPARLKVPWSGVEEYVARERRWDEVLQSAVGISLTEELAASRAFRQYAYVAGYTRHDGLPILKGGTHGGKDEACRAGADPGSGGDAQATGRIENGAGARG